MRIHVKIISNSKDCLPKKEKLIEIEPLDILKTSRVVKREREMRNVKRTIHSGTFLVRH